MMNHIKNTLLILILALLVLPALQKRFYIISSAPLKGLFHLQEKPLFSTTSWLSGSYQQLYQKYRDDQPGFRPDLVRLFNQVDYSFFSQPHAAKIIAGKEGYLFGDQYIEAWLGTDFMGENYIDQKISQVKYLQDFLWEKKKILLLVIFTPDKGTFYREMIPDRYLAKKKEVNNYILYAKKCQEAGINVIDFNSLFLRMKDTSKYILYPKTGVHWSTYGAVLAADSLTRYLSKKLSIRMPEMVIDSIILSTIPRDEDDDISRTMNLIFPVSQPVLAYPVFHFRGDSNAKKPAALFIGDSFYWNWYNPGIIRNLFSNEPFWYYDKEVYPENKTSPMNTGLIDLKSNIENQDVIILMQVNGGEGNLGYGFVDRAFAEYDTSINNPVRKIEATMRNSQDYVNLLAKKAKEWNVTLDAMKRIDAIYLYNQELLQKNQNKK
jgi:hypothetical protein